MKVHVRNKTQKQKKHTKNGAEKERLHIDERTLTARECNGARHDRTPRDAQKRGTYQESFHKDEHTKRGFTKMNAP